MKLTILGCSGPVPCAGGATSGYLLTEGGENYLMDCGSGVLGRLTALLSPLDVNAVLLSHLHFDHMSDLMVMQYALAPSGVHTPVYLPGDDHSPQRALLESGVYAVHEWQDEQTVGSLCVQTFSVRHPVPCRALRISANGKTLVFTGDTSTCAGLADFCRGADVLLADAAFLKDEWNENLPHISAAHAGQLAKDAGVQRLYLTHLPLRHAPESMEKEAREYFPDACAVAPGMTIEI